MNDKTAITMAIDLKKNRLRIHRQTLKLMGFPAFVRLLISPKDSAIVILGRREQTPGGQEYPVVFDKPGPAGTYDIYCKELISRIRKQFPGMDREGLYRLSGSWMPEEECVCFPLGTLNRAEETHVPDADL